LLFKFETAIMNSATAASATSRKARASRRPSVPPRAARADPPGSSVIASQAEPVTAAQDGLHDDGTARIVLADPAGLLEPHRAGELVAELAELSGLPVGLYCQGAARSGMALALEAAVNLDRAHLEALVRPMAEALPWLLDVPR